MSQDPSLSLPERNEKAAPARALRTRPVRVLKFGGSSVGSEDRIRKVAELVARVAESCTPIVVVSAVQGTTDALSAIADQAGEGDDAYLDRLQEVEARHHRLLRALAAPEDLEGLEARLEAAVRDLKRRTQGAHLLGELSLRARDRILAFGESLSAMLVAAALRALGTPARDVDARDLIRTDDRFGAARVDLAVSTRLIRDRLPGEGGIPVVTGFLGATASGDTTTLGRGASDYTATLLGSVLEVDGIEIWTDVDGILTADPRTVPEANPVREIGYDELLELAHFGAEVVCPPAVDPARRAGIPLRIRSTLDPTLPGTLVVDRPRPDPERPVRGISAIRNVALIRLEGVETLGVTETAERIFRALRTAEVQPLLFTQDSSAHSLSVAVARDRLEAAEATLAEEFRREREGDLLPAPVVERHRSILAIVGEGMRDTPGIAGRLFSTLGAARVNVHAVAQGSSERNISWVVASGDEDVALRAVHRAFFGSPPRALEPVRLVVLGVGSVGSAFLDQLRDHGRDALAPRGLEPVLAGVVRSRIGRLEMGGIDPARWREALEGGRMDPRAVVDAVVGRAGPVILVDCTASPEVAARYPDLLRRGVAVVTANKLAFSGPYEAYRALERASARGGGSLHHETTVGAGIPMVRTVAGFRATGDRILSLEGIFSGTLSFLFDRVGRGTGFSRAVREAMEGGISEPDPREDLAMSDVIRKALILARTAGFPLEPEDVTLDPLLPGEVLEAGSLDAFLDALEAHDEAFARRSRAAAEEGRRLAPLARIAPSGIRVGLEALPEAHPAVRLSGTENFLEIRSERYGDHPLRLQGPGAGPEVTAAGLLADLVGAAEQASRPKRERPHVG